MTNTEMRLNPAFYSNDTFIVRSVNLATGNYVHEGPFDNIVDAANYISRHWSVDLGNMSEEPTLIPQHRPRPDITDEEGDEPFPELEY